MKKILYFLKDYKKESVIAPLFKMLEAIFELIVPLVCVAVGADENDKILFHPLGSEIQKQVFPEIIGRD